MFEIQRTDTVELGRISSPELRDLVSRWVNSQRGTRLPLIGNLDPRLLGNNLGRMHLLEVLGPRKFLFLLYGCQVTNPDAMSMSGMTTDDYENKVFAQLVTTHYQEVVDQRRPICRHIIATKGGKPYEYVRLTLPFSDNGDDVDLLLVATRRVSVPSQLDWRRQDDDESYVAMLVEELKPAIEGMDENKKAETISLIRRFGTALIWNLAQEEARRLNLPSRDRPTL